VTSSESIAKNEKIKITTGFLPGFQIRVSPRAKRIRLVIAPDTGLTVVLPRGVDHAVAGEVVASRREWIERTMARMEGLRQAPEPPPSLVELRAVERTVAVRYRPGGAASVSVREAGPATIAVCGDIARRDLVDRALRGWLRREAGRLLPPRLAELSHLWKLPHAGVVVRLQRTRWGSCSAKGCISLNARLVFLPPDLCDYVLAHELAHTIHLNHSPRYWTALETLMPEARGLDRALRTARNYVPQWARG